MLACSSGDPTDNGDNGGNSTVALADAALYALAAPAAGFSWFANSTDTLQSSAGTGHIERRLRIRMNARAATQLDAQGYFRAGASFPDSSLIVKELYDATGRITTLAVMLKRRGDPNAAANDWLWGYFDGSGNVKFALSTRGSVCTSCHSSGNDYTRANDLR
ncbi:MAG: cytochrome P460 family protein [Gemmatimonadetes bacterium]|nr:cytochrome P460 family protein [Gemmatimonadota bacterium]